MNSWQQRLATLALYKGGVIAYPTEGVYGLGCLPLYWPAVSRILDLKQRPVEKGLILVAAFADQLKPFIEFPDEATRQEVLSSWPGPVTWLLPARPAVPVWIRGAYDSVAVRVSDHEIVKQLCYKAGPLVSTSANPSGLPPAKKALKVRSYFKGELDYIVPGRVGMLRYATPIRDARTGKFIRQGG